MRDGIEEPQRLAHLEVLRRRALDLEVEHVMPAATAVPGSLRSPQRVVRDQPLGDGVGEHPAERDETVLEGRLGQSLGELRALVASDERLVDRAKREAPERRAQMPAPDTLVLVEGQR